MRFSDGSVMRLYRQTLEDFGIYAGKELDSSAYRNLQTAAGQMSAKMRAVRIVASTSVSKKDLHRRLVQKGEDPEQAAQAVNWMSDMALVDDRRTAEEIVNRCIRKGYGLARAKQVLYEKQIPKDIWEDALSEYPQQLEAIMAFLRSRLSDMTDKKELRKAIDSLMRKGHSYGSIKQALNQLLVDTDEFLED